MLHSRWNQIFNNRILAALFAYGKFYVNVFALVIALLFSGNLLILTWNDESVILIAHLIDDPYCNDKFWLKSHDKKFNCTCLFAASISAGYFMPTHSNNISLYQLHFAVFIAQIFVSVVASYSRILIMWYQKNHSVTLYYYPIFLMNYWTPVGNLLFADKSRVRSMNF